MDGARLEEWRGFGNNDPKQIIDQFIGFLWSSKQMLGAYCCLWAAIQSKESEVIEYALQGWEIIHSP